MPFSRGDAAAPGASGAGQSEAAGKVPVVEVVFDELPTATLVTPSGARIDRRRFPGFARLAAHSTWYRDNTTVADFTGRALPAIETGINPDYTTLPIASQQPHSIFTLLGGSYRLNVSEPVTHVCPRSLCGGESAGRQLAGKPLTGGDFAQDLFVPPRPGEFQRWLKRIRPRGPSLNFIHFELPHEPFHFLPDGRSYNFTPISDVATANAQRWGGGVGGTATTWQRHFIQTAYADALIARTIARLRRVGIWRRALLIVTADHGISFLPSSYRRIAVPGNFGGIANPPLFVKYPGQTRGQLSDLHTRTIDIVPTIAEVLGIDLPYRTDGVPISADTDSGPVTIANGFKKYVAESLSEVIAERSAVLRSAARQLGSRTGLWQLGPRPELLGRRAARAHGRRAALDTRLDYAHVRLGGGAKVPAFVNGTVGGGAAGKVVAIAVNGRVVATCRAFRFHGRTHWGAIVPPSKLHAGSDSVAAYVVR